MKSLSLRIAMAFAMIFLVAAGVASASAGDITLREVLRSGDVTDACRTNDRLLATFKFAKAELASPDKCVVYRFIANDDAQRRCFSAIATAAGQASFLSSLGIGDGVPSFCHEGCNCQDTISYRTID